jgi:hypothetical protein
MIHASAADLLSAYVRGGAFGCSDTYLASFFLLRLGSFCIDIAYIYIYIYIYINVLPPNFVISLVGKKFFI